MIGIIVFFVVLTIVLIALRFAGDKFYDKFYPLTLKSDIKTETIAENKISNQNSQNDELIAVVIAAAVFETFSGVVSINKISFIGDDSNSAWKNSGRLTNLSSHNLNRKK